MPDVLRKREASWKQVTEDLVCSAEEVRIWGGEEHATGESSQSSTLLDLMAS